MVARGVLAVQGSLGWLAVGLVLWASGLAAAAAPPEAKLRIDGGHPWRPPFGLDRVGRPLVVIAELPATVNASSTWEVVGYRDGVEIERHAFGGPSKPPYAARVAFAKRPTEVVLFTTPTVAKGAAVAARLRVEPAALEADAVARPETVVCPVDLGTILVPHDWLLVSGGQRARLQVAAVGRTSDAAEARAQVEAWYESAPERKSVADVLLNRDLRAELTMPLPAAPTRGDRDVVHVRIVAGRNGELWRKTIPTMLVQNPPRWPAFGALRTRLRYDAPISVRKADGSFSSLRYEDGWPKQLDDVAVFLPNGARFVFWRGSSYIPFWAGRNNTGLCYEWAETSPPKDGFADCVEPLMDKQCRYGRVTIEESTAARVHVRWSYQSCDFQYKVWGDSAVEDYYFYPDGFGTRVLTLQAALGSDYELSEFIVLAPQSAYPLDILPRNLVDVLFLDGEKRSLDFPFLPAEQGAKAKSRDMAAIYRVRFSKDERLSGVYFNPNDKQLPPAIFAPFYDRGQLVTPNYWGSHWPLARGNTTGAAIDDRILLSPSHNSVMSWARSRPTPLRTARLHTLDTLGRSKPMTVETWAWLIGMTDADDRRLLDWAHSFANPPTIELEGGRWEAESYVPERRAIRLIVDRPELTMTLRPSGPCVNPVFELVGAPQGNPAVTLNDRTLDPKHYAWDGRTLWLGMTFSEVARLRLQFQRPK